MRKLIIEKLDVKKVNEVIAEAPATATLNLCEEEVVLKEEMVINHSYINPGRQMMILNIGALVSIAGISWIT